MLSRRVPRGRPSGFLIFSDIPNNKLLQFNAGRAG